MSKFDGVKLAAARWLVQGMTATGGAKANPIGRVLMSSLSMIAPSFRTYTSFVRRGYQLNSTVYRCINEISSSMSTVELEAVRVRSNGEEVVLDYSPLLSLLRRPNPRETWEEFLAHALIDWGTQGEIYLCAVQTNINVLPTEIWLLPPEKMQVKPSDTGIASGYIYRGQKGDVFFPVDPKTGLGPVLQIKEYNPDDHWRGQSPLMAAGLSIDTHNQAMIWNNNLLRNGARPTGALVMPATIGPEHYAQLREEVDLLYSGPSNAGRPMVLEGGMEWKEMGIVPKDMEFKDNLNAVSMQIASALGVPFALVNPDSATYSNMETANLMFYEKTVIPRLKKILTSINMWLAPAARGEMIRHNEDSISALEPRRKAKTERLSGAAEKGILTRDEARQELGYSPVGGLAGTLFINGSQVPIEDAGLVDTAVDQTLPEDEETEEVLKALMGSGYSEDEAHDILARQFNMKAKRRELKTSRFRHFDQKLADQIRHAAPELWLRATASDALEAKAGGNSMAREMWGLRNFKRTDLNGVMQQMAWGIVGSLGEKGMMKLVQEEIEYMKASKTGGDVRAIGEIKAGDFVRQGTSGTQGKVLEVFMAKGGTPDRAMVRTYLDNGKGGLELGEIVSIPSLTLSQIEPLE